MKTINPRFLAACLFSSALFGFCHTARAQNEQVISMQMKQADTKLNSTYQTLLGHLNEDGKSLLKSSERAWITFRDAEAQLASGVHRTTREYELVRLINEREVELDGMIRRISGLPSREPVETQVQSATPVSSEEIKRQIEAAVAQANREAAEANKKAQAAADEAMRKAQIASSNAATSMSNNDARAQATDEQLSELFNSKIANAAVLYKADKYEEAKLELLQLNSKSFRDASRSNSYLEQIKGLMAMIDGKSKPSSIKSNASQQNDPELSDEDRKRDDEAIKKMEASLQKVADLLKQNKPLEAEIELNISRSIYIKDWRRSGSFAGTFLGLRNMIDEMKKKEAK